MKRVVSAAAALASAAVFSVASASAGNSHGTPPGQDKKNDTSASASVQTSAGAHAKAHAKPSAGASVEAEASGKTHGAVETAGNARAAVTTHALGQAHAAAKARRDAHARGAASVSASASAGVKPSSTTAFETTAPAASTQTKLYGNGQTTGQIATAAGAGASVLSGPGNSQPHKTGCGSKVIDVHALKAHSRACGGASASVEAKAHLHAKGRAAVLAMLEASAAAQAKLYGNTVTAAQIAAQLGLGEVTLVAVGSSGAHKVMVGGRLVDVHALKAHLGTRITASAGQGPTQASAAAQAGAQATAQQTVAAKAKANRAGAKAGTSGSGGVLGAFRSLANSGSRGAGNALAATGRGGTLPFTGLSLWFALAAAAGLIAGGLAIRRATATHV